MLSSIIGKVQKAHVYAQEPDRVTFQSLQVRFRGDNSEHVVTLREGEWDCTCNFFRAYGFCCHTMAMQKILGVMLPEAATDAGCPVAIDDRDRMALAS